MPFPAIAAILHTPMFLPSHRRDGRIPHLPSSSQVLSFAAPIVEYFLQVSRISFSGAAAACSVPSVPQPPAVSCLLYHVFHRRKQVFSLPSSSRAFSFPEIRSRFRHAVSSFPEQIPVSYSRWDQETIDRVRRSPGFPRTLKGPTEAWFLIACQDGLSVRP